MNTRRSRYALPLLLLLLLLCGLAAVGWISLAPDDAAPAKRLDIKRIASPAEILAAGNPPPEPTATYRFGFDLRNGPQEDARQYLSLLRYLERSTGYHFRLSFSETSRRLLNDLERGHLQFAAIGAGTYLTASRNSPILPLVRGLNAAGEAGYRSILVVAPHSPLQRIQDLRGRSLAFGSTTSTQGYWIPRIMLHQAGLGLADLGAYRFTGSHRACAEAVIAGKADACGMQDILARQLIEKGRLRQLAVSAIYPSSGIFANAGVPGEVRAAVRQALIALDPHDRRQADLYNWQKTEMAGGFIAAEPEDYEPLRVWAQRLGLLQTDLNTHTGQ